MNPTEHKLSFLPLLEERRKKLDQKPFDWSAWKKGTLLVLKGAFGENSAYHKQLSQTEYEYSSWSLRDTSGSGDPVKSACAELLDICMIDLKSSSFQQNSTEALAIDSYRKFLPQATIEEIRAILGSDLPPFQQEEKVLNILTGQDTSTVLRLLTSLSMVLLKAD
ncbi:hypothetical protein [Alkaliflexus imshenetskii]|uniref:hypothetical protein n=1 Tax=Alkaliflexus imshenetskii TaxID=286730 RepID=UPI0004B70FC9|nr:hypothetical protein [Alkaliflexus imshenetskii]